MSTTCGCSNKAPEKKILFFSCSGGSNVAEVADRAARQLMSEGLGSVFCLAGLGAGIPNMIETAKSADLNVVLDGCPADCAKKIFANVGINNTKIIRLTDVGLEKKPKGVRATEEEVNKVTSLVKQMLNEA